MYRYMDVKLEKEIEEALACKSERLIWLEHFKQFANIDTINRTFGKTGKSI